LHFTWRQPLQPQFALEFLPPYSPELNPIERVWKLRRRLCLHHRYFGFLEGVMEAVEVRFADGLKANETLRRLCANI
jgi:transposase